MKYFLGAQMDLIYFHGPYETNNNFVFFKYDTFGGIKLSDENNLNNQYVVVLKLKCTYVVVSTISCIIIM